MSNTWYADGLRFSCHGCGECCRGGAGYVWVDRREIRRLARRLALSVDDFGARYLRRVGRRLSLIERPNGDCIFWQEGCQVYDDRPRQCRTFPFWSRILRSRRDWDKTGRLCPGMGQGRLFTPEEIERLRDGAGETPPGPPRAAHQRCRQDDR